MTNRCEKKISNNNNSNSNNNSNNNSQFDLFKYINLSIA